MQTENSFFIITEYERPVFEATIFNIKVTSKNHIDAYEQAFDTENVFLTGVFRYGGAVYGTLCERIRIREKEDHILINARAVERVIVTETSAEGLFGLYRAQVSPFAFNTPTIANEEVLDYVAKTNAAIAEARDHRDALPAFADLVDISADTIDSWLQRHGKLLSAGDTKAMFADKDDGVRLMCIYDAILTELKHASWDQEIEREVNENINKDQKDYYLHEKLKVINKELYNTESDSEVYYTKIKNLNADDEVKEKLFAELAKVNGMQLGSPESYVARNYIDTVCSLPWGVYSQEILSLERAKEILEEDHYGIQDVKERVMEFLAIHKLVKNKKGNILCFYGPPGTGKTSVVKSIARALDRKYVRLSLGGVHDEAEIRGHRRTYIGALAGKIITGIRDAGTMNPVFLMDEVDKLSADQKGDPASALLEVLDPEQNKAFRDNFIDLPFDLSQVLFITTANNIATISKPLLDRMELIEMSSYTFDEKREIALRHLIPKQLKEHAVPDNTIVFTPEAVDEIVDQYTMEAGVRRLEQMIAKIIRKIAVKYGDVGYQPLTVDKKDIQSYLGAPKHRDNDSRKAEAGVITGLAFTEYGGVTLEMECVLTAGKGEVVLTGNLGDVMKESAKEALTYVKAHAEEYGIPATAFQQDIHINATEGGVPKDGPSAGIALTTLILSAFTGKKIRADYALTGEVTIKGKVLPIGGVKEKTLGALRKGITNVILPEANRVDAEELPDGLKEKVKFTFVDRVEQVFEVMLLEDNER